MMSLKEYFTELCKLKHWSVRTFKQKIDSMLYERTAISKHPEEVIAEELKELKSGYLNNPSLYLQDPYTICSTA